MKRIITIMALVLAAMTIARADDRPVTYNQLPKPAQAFITEYYPAEKVSFATKDDDLINPDYQVVLASGVKLEFRNDGSLSKLEVRNGEVPAGVVPVQIVESVKTHYPDAVIREYEVGRRTYEVKLSNRMELKFNRDFHVIELDY